LLANPPYGSQIDGETLDASLRGLNTSKTELLFVARALQLLRPSGRAAIIVPDSVLFHQGRAAVALRQTLITKHDLHAIISLPAGIFAPHTNVKTSILVLTHSGKTRTIWCYSVEQDGYTLDKRRRPTPHQNDFPDLSVKYGLHFADMFSSCYPSASSTTIRSCSGPILKQSVKHTIMHSRSLRKRCWTQASKRQA
jgi:hypothetical protein